MALAGCSERMGCLASSGAARGLDDPAAVATSAATAAKRRSPFGGSVVRLTQFWERQRGSSFEVLPDVGCFPVRDELIGGSRLAPVSSPRTAAT